MYLMKTTVRLGTVRAVATANLIADRVIAAAKAGAK
jgi:hypothetical protein